MTYYIAELCSNHNGDIHRALELIEAVKDVGFDAVKTQMLSKWEDVYCERYAVEKYKSNPYYPFTPNSWHPMLCEYTHELGMDYIVTTLNTNNLDRISQMKWSAGQSIDYIKFGSYELLNYKMMRKATKIVSSENSGVKGIIVSTGAATMPEIMSSLSLGGALDLPDGKLSILHCVSAYTTPEDQVNLLAIEALKRAFPGVAIGYSDHTANVNVVIQAVNLGAEVIEVHFDLDSIGNENGHSYFLDDPYGYSRDARNIINMTPDNEFESQRDERLGDGYKFPQECERDEVYWRADPLDEKRPLRAVRGVL
jgi:N-acetylneuraminate synthase